MIMESGWSSIPDPSLSCYLLCCTVQVLLCAQGAQKASIVKGVDQSLDVMELNKENYVIPRFIMIIIISRNNSINICSHRLIKYLH